MIEYTTGNIFDAEVEAIVNPTNARGPMGAGLAKQFRDKYPGLEKDYRRHCDQWFLEHNAWPVGRVMPWFCGDIDPKHKFVFCFPTKDDWRLPAKVEYIEAGFASLIPLLHFYNVDSIALPALGMGLGGLKPEQVKPVVERVFNSLSMIVKFYDR